MRQKIIIFLILFGLGFSGWLNGQEEPLKEKVEVINTEVPVRVFLAGAPVAGLTRDDFQLFEGKEKQAINGFYSRTKKMNVEKVTLQAETAAPASRYFVLVFRILEYNEQMKKGVHYIFDHILRDNDKLLVMINDRTVTLNRDVWKVKRREILDQLLNEEAGKARQNLEHYFLAVQKNLDLTRLHILFEGHDAYAQRILEFLNDYLRTWDEFKNKYLIPDLDKFYNFARHLEKVKEEKWVLTFYQIEMFPNMKISGQLRQQLERMLSAMEGGRSEDIMHGRMIGQLLNRIDQEFNLADSFPAEEVSKMLIKVDTTYHCFIMGVQRETLSEDLGYKQVSSDIEHSLSEITRRSGGEVVFSGDVSASLHSVEEKEDIYYVLTYEPVNPARKGKVRVELPGRPGCKLFYDDNIRADYIGEYLQKKKAGDPSLLLEALDFKGRQLQVKISSFKTVAMGKGENGQLLVAVRIHDSQNKLVYDRNRNFDTKHSRVELSIDLKFLEPGKYMFIVEAHDLLTGKIAMDILQAEAE
jgi:hypothetical protein